MKRPTRMPEKTKDCNCLVMTTQKALAHIAHYYVYPIIIL